MLRRLDGLGTADLPLSGFDAAGSSRDDAGSHAKRKRDDPDLEHG